MNVEDNYCRRKEREASWWALKVMGAMVSVAGIILLTVWLLG